MAYHGEAKPVPDAVDHIAAEEPESLYGKYPIDPADYAAGFANVTFAQLANAANGVAWWLENQVGRGDENQIPTIAYIGPNDFRYVFAFIGAIKAGYKLFLTSPRNSLVAHLSLLESLDCTKIIVAGSAPPIIDEILKARPMRLLEIAGMEHLMNSPSQPYPYQKPLDKARRDDAFVCHTSGTTGIPKHSIYTHEFILRCARILSLPTPDGYTSLMSALGNNTQVLVLPFFHPAGVQLGVINAIYNRCVVVIPSWAAPPSTEGLTALVQNVQADWAMTSPFTLETLAKDEALLDQVASRLKMLVFAGGALPKPLGDVIAKKIRLASFLGSSETAGIPILYPKDFDVAKDWEYMCFHPKVGIAYQARVEDAFELVLEKSPSTEPYQPVFNRFPELETFPTGDLFRQHPVRQDMWAHASRANDIIVFLNGEKTNPVSFESHLSKHPDISGAVVFGDQRFEAGILIELKSESASAPQQRDEYIKKIWPTIEEANQDAPMHARIAATHVLFTTPEQPLLRTPKGTVMRKASLGLYAQAIDDLYQAVESTRSGGGADSAPKVNIDDLDAIVAAIQLACKESTTIPDVGKDDNILTRGADSLQVLRLCRNLRSSVGIDNLKPTTVYSNPTPVALAKAIQGVVRGQGNIDKESRGSRESRLEGALAPFTRRIDELANIQSQTAEKQDGAGNGHVCLITGTTGSIGSYILRSLIKDANIGTIYCLNRGPDSISRQRKHNAEVDPELPTTFPENVHFLEGDLTHPSFNLSPELFETLSSSVTLIVHNAWSVDFNLPLPSFTKHLVGVESLCKFSAQGSRRPAILFLSSISAVMDLALRPDQAVPEEILTDLSVSAPVGYAESKYLAERILGYAGAKLQIPIAVARIGQVCGATHSPGRWNPNEWIPRLIKGSASLGALPDSLGDYGVGLKDVDWVPVDVIADAIVEILLKATSGERPTDTRLYHLVNSQRTSWAESVPAIVATLNDLNARHGSKTTVRVVSRQEWLQSLRSSGNNLDTLQSGGASADVNPALRLIDFYEEKFAEKVFPQWETANAASLVAIQQGAAGISHQDIEKWIRLWW
ncbi:hypothetical protein F4861DRAFT_548893 [Xylaria intraflava]|nr:hypothetical protein F4861DRAFT_548893 [Xylaria intraflava]